LAEQGQTNGVQWRLSSLERRVDRVEERSELLTSLRIEVREVKKDLEGFLTEQKIRDKADETRQLQMERDRKQDRKWQIGIAVAMVTAVIAAMAIIVPLLVG
jgi:vacuolar-type H+-ATPase subunit I/STV1